MSKTIHLELTVDSPEALEVLKPILGLSKKKTTHSKTLSDNDRLLAIEIKLDMILNRLNMQTVSNQSVDDICNEARRQGLSADEMVERYNAAMKARRQLNGN